MFKDIQVGDSVTMKTPQGQELLHGPGRFQKPKIGPNMFFSDLTNDQRGLLIRVR